MFELPPNWLIEQSFQKEVGLGGIGNWRFWEENICNSTTEMEFVPCYVPTSFCCLIISKTKNDVVVLQQEIERLSVLEDECNKKLDEFYASKQEFEFMLRNLANKMLGPELDDHIEEKQIIDEFTDYVNSVWQFGADKLGQAQKKLQYISLVDGLPLSVYIQALQNNIEKGSMSIAQTVCHPYCTSLFYSMYTEITGDLFVRLSTADMCFRQYEYLKKSLPFLQKLKDFIKTYIEKEKVCSIKLFSDEVISCINLKILGDEDFDDKENLGAFRSVVNLLTGKLLGCDNIPDPHSEILPVVIDISKRRPGKNVIVKRLVDFFLKDDIENPLKSVNNNVKFIIGNNNNMLPLSVIDNERLQETDIAMNVASQQVFDINGTLYQVQDTSLEANSTNSGYDPFQNCFQAINLNFASQPLSPSTCVPPVENYPPRYYETQGRAGKYNTTSHKRGPKPVHSGFDVSMDINCDLKPIKIPKLKQDLIKPLT